MAHKYNWLTCPFCNEAAKRYIGWDIHKALGLTMEAWQCHNRDCEKVFYTVEGDNEA